MFLSHSDHRDGGPVVGLQALGDGGGAAVCLRAAPAPLERRLVMVSEAVHADHQVWVSNLGMGEGGTTWSETLPCKVLERPVPLVLSLLDLLSLEVPGLQCDPAGTGYHSSSFPGQRLSTEPPSAFRSPRVMEWLCRMLPSGVIICPPHQGRGSSVCVILPAVSLS